MNTPSEEPTRNAQVTREDEWEQAHGRLHEELTEGCALLPPAAEEEEQARPQTRTRPRRSSRRKMLTKGLGVAAVAGVGAGALLELSGGTALAASTPKPGVFASSTAGTPAVKATGTNGADGVDASSDSGIGVSATSGSGTALVATSSTGLAAHFVGNVKLDNALTVAGTLSSGAGSFTSTTPGTGVLGRGSFGGDGVAGVSDSGSGVHGSSTSGSGVLGFSTSGSSIKGISGGLGGLAGEFIGDVQVTGNFTATGTKSFVQAHPTDPGREIVYVALEGGEAGTYVRGSGQLQSGKAVLALPEHFALVTETSGLTIQLTPRGEWLQLYVVELDTAQLVVREAQGKSGRFDYFICGVRRGYEQHEVIRTKR